MPLNKHGLEISNGLVISDLKVMHSNAGYYLGHGYIEQEFLADITLEDVTEDMLGFPYDRQSDYFSTKEEAEHMLEYVNTFD